MYLYPNWVVHDSIYFYGDISMSYHGPSLFNLPILLIPLPCETEVSSVKDVAVAVTAGKA